MVLWHLSAWRGLSGLVELAQHGTARQGMAWHSTQPLAPGAQHRPVPLADVQMFPATPLAAACVWKVMNFCTN